LVTKYIDICYNKNKLKKEDFMKQRAITGIIVSLIMIPLILFDVLLIPFKIVIGLMAMLAVYELVRMYETKHELHLANKIVIFLITAALYLVIGNVWLGPNAFIYDMPLNPMYVLFPAVIILFILCVFNAKMRDQSLGFSFLTIFYIGLGFGALTYLKVLGAEYLLYLLITTITTDSFAFFFGVKFGRHKMCPTISPKKSWEGAIAGTVFGTVFGTLFGVIILPTNSGTIFDTAATFLLENASAVSMFDVLAVRTSPAWGLLSIFIPLTLAISVIGQLGDLFASKLKRTYEIKDFGTILPGHGGILDRFDSALFAGTFLVFIFKVMSILWPGI
jgi:phosphatidate cytidylyltransferase